MFVLRKPLAIYLCNKFNDSVYFGPSGNICQMYGPKYTKRSSSLRTELVNQNSQSVKFGNLHLFSSFKGNLFLSKVGAATSIFEHS